MKMKKKEEQQKPQTIFSCTRCNLQKPQSEVYLNHKFVLIFHKF